MPLIGGMTLAGCTTSAPVQPYIYTAPVPNGWSFRDGGTYAPPVAPPPPVFSPRVGTPPPLRPIAPDPPALRFLPPVTLLTPPADATDCTGWWRICHLY